jgi:hypothetical protein
MESSALEEAPSKIVPSNVWLYMSKNSLIEEEVKDISSEWF